MTEIFKAVILSKAAKEFNIGRDTIVDFLKGKGFDINPNPNSKLTEEMYNLLTAEYHEDKEAREKAEQRKLEFIGKESISIKDKATDKKEAPGEEPASTELFIKDTGLPFVSTPTGTKKDKKEETIEEVKPKPEEKAESVPETKEETVTAEEEKAAPEEEKAEAEVKGLKVVDTIDLDGLNQKTRPKKKTKAQKEKEAAGKQKDAEKTVAKPKKAEVKKQEPETEKVAEAKPVTKEEAEPKTPEPKKESNFLATKVEKLAGPKVMGKIDLPEDARPKKKKPVASSSDVATGKKKKRKRIRTKQTGATAAATDESRGRKGKKGAARKAAPQLTEEQIQKQIKETLARLTPTGKSKASKHRRQKRDTISQHRQEELERQEQEKGILKVTEFVTANELASMMDANVNEIIKVCMQLGLFVSINQRLDAETISLVTEEFGYQVDFVSVDDSESLDIVEEEDKPEDLSPRTPIVTVMGHVDHGKTKLLDYIRKANVVAGEAGGITQHIGAYEVETESGKKITFLDTPGHEAFTAMRARGAKVTDIAIIVIAADDSVMPQTKEAINHAQAAGVPIVFAFNKMDKPGANSDKIKEQLSQMNILVEEWGGKFQSQEISAITGMGIPDLLEKTLLEAEMLDLKANPNKPGKGTVIEAQLDKGRGYVATVLVQDGMLKKGDILLAGPIFGKVKAMFNERNQPIEKAGPSQPSVILGLTAAPQAGDMFNVMKEEKEAKQLASKRLQLMREQSMRTQKHITLDEIGRRLAIGDFKELNIIVKGDVDGSIEALTDALLKLSTDEVQVNVIHKAVGAITESDVMLASASDAIIIGFQVRPVPQARKLAEKEQIDIRLYSIIYQATEELEDAIKGMHAPKM